MHCDVEAHWGGCGLRLIYNFTWLDGVGGKGVRCNVFAGEVGEVCVVSGTWVRSVSPSD